MILNFFLIFVGDLLFFQQVDNGNFGFYFFFFNEMKQMWKVVGVFVNSVEEIECFVFEGF